MQISSNAFLKYFSVALFVIYFFVGLIIFNDYGITTDEEFQRFSGFFWLKYVLSFTHFEELKALVENKLNLIKGFTLPRYSRPISSTTGHGGVNQSRKAHAPHLTK